MNLKKATQSSKPGRPRRQEVRIAKLPRLEVEENSEELNPFFALDERFYAACSKGVPSIHSGSRLYDALDRYAQRCGGGAA